MREKQQGYCALNIRKKKSWEGKLDGAFLCRGMMSRTYRSSVRSCTDKTPCDRHNTEMDLKYIKGENVDWIHLAEDTDQ